MENNEVVYKCGILPNSVSHYITCDVKLYTAAANQIIFTQNQDTTAEKNARFGFGWKFELIDSNVD